MAGGTHELDELLAMVDPGVSITAPSSARGQMNSPRSSRRTYRASDPQEFASRPPRLGGRVDDECGAGRVLSQDIPHGLDRCVVASVRHRDVPREPDQEIERAGRVGGDPVPDRYALLEHERVQTVTPLRRRGEPGHAAGA